jgi:hypothetical protein
MNLFQLSQLLHMFGQIQSLVSEREAMVAKNQSCLSFGNPPDFTFQDFMHNASAIAAVVPDPHQFG